MSVSASELRLWSSCYILLRLYIFSSSARSYFATPKNSKRMLLAQWIFQAVSFYLVPLFSKEIKRQWQCSTNQNTQPQAIFLTVWLLRSQINGCLLKEKNSIETWVSTLLDVFSFVLFMTLIISSLLSFDVNIYIHLFVHPNGLFVYGVSWKKCVCWYIGYLGPALRYYKLYTQTQESNPIRIVNA